MLDYSYTQDIIEEAKTLEDKISAIKQKIENGEALSFIEKEEYGKDLHSTQKNTDVLDKDIFKEYKFKFLLFRYMDDLTFQGTYYKLNPEKCLMESDLKTILNNRGQEPDFGEYQRKQLIEKGFYIEIPADEIAKDKAYLLADAKKWAKKMSKTRHKDPNLCDISKETRDTIKKLKPKVTLDKYVDGDFDNSEQFYDITTVIFKSKYVHFETLKCLEEMSVKSRKSVFPFLSGEVHYTYMSIIHIMNRHFAQLLLSSNILSNKTFHNTNIHPCKMGILIGEIFSEIEKTGLRKSETLVPNAKVFFQYKSSDYVIFIQPMKHDKTKFEVRTFTEIDNRHIDGKKYYIDIKNNHYPVPVDYDLSIYYSIN